MIVEENEKSFYEVRLNICKQCPAFFKQTGQCKECGCYVRVKTRAKTEACPIGKW